MISDDYLEFQTFLDWCRVWELDGRCPLPFVDWLLDQGLDAEAEAARWAAMEPNRPVYMYPDSVRNEFGGIYPYVFRAFSLADGRITGYAWGADYSGHHVRCALPLDVFEQLRNKTRAMGGREKFAEIIFLFLRAWAEARPLPTETEPLPLATETADDR